jgi:hypothetical protein
MKGSGMEGQRGLKSPDARGTGGTPGNGTAATAAQRSDTPREKS